LGAAATFFVPRKTTIPRIGSPHPSPPNPPPPSYNRARPAASNIPTVAGSHVTLSRHYKLLYIEAKNFFSFFISSMLKECGDFFYRLCHFTNVTNSREDNAAAMIKKILIQTSNRETNLVIREMYSIPHFCQRW
jgi:hypothetical protein